MGMAPVATRLSDANARNIEDYRLVLMLMWLRSGLVEFGSWYPCRLATFHACFGHGYELACARSFTVYRLLRCIGH